MKKSKMIVYTLGISAALHGFTLFYAAKNGFHILPVIPETRFVSTVKVIKTAIAPQERPPDNPEEKTAETPVNPTREPLPAAETPENSTPEPLPSGEQHIPVIHGDTSGEETGISPEVREGADTAGETGAVSAGEYDRLLAYIKDFISKNLVYPPMARRRNIEGVVGVYFEIDAHGVIISVAVARPSGSSILDNAAVSLVKRIRPPGTITIKGTVSLNVNVDYKLTD